jgi:hypothetical protein
MRAAAPLLGVRQAARMSFARQTLQRIAQRHNFAKKHLVLRERHKEDAVRFRTAPGDVAGMMLFALENFDVERILISMAERGIRSREKVEGSGRAGVRAPAVTGGVNPRKDGGEVRARSGSPRGWAPPLLRRVARHVGRASDGGSEGMALHDPLKKFEK